MEHFIKTTLNSLGLGKGRVLSGTSILADLHNIYGTRYEITCKENPRENKYTYTLTPNEPSHKTITYTIHYKMGEGGKVITNTDVS